MKTKTEEPHDEQKRVLAEIANVAGACRGIEAEFRRNSPPTLELLIKIHRTLAMKLLANLEQSSSAEGTQLLTALMKPVMEFARIEESRADRRFARERFRAARQAQFKAGLELLLTAYKGVPGAIELVHQAHALAAHNENAEQAIETQPCVLPPPLPLISSPVGPPTDSSRRTENGPLPPCKP